MRLTELRPQFLIWESAQSFRDTDKIEEADGIRFLCPKCFERNNKQRPGVHSVICWRPSIKPEMPPGPGRWELSGTGYEDLTLTAPSSSIALSGGCNAHFYIRNGEIVGA